MSPKNNPKKRVGWIWKILGPLAIGYILIIALVYVVQRKLMYFPHSTPAPTPDEQRFPGLETVELKTLDGLRVLGWYWPGTRPVTLLIFHGNAGNRWHRLPWMEDLHSLGLGVFVLDYRGYGGSEGSPSEKGLYLDAEAAVTWLRDRGQVNLVYLGESLGTGVATELALRHPPSGIILQSGFTSAVDLAAKIYPFLPVSMLMRDRYESTKKLPEIKAPVMVIHGDQDAIIPVEFGQGLFDAAKDPKELLLIPDAGHNDLPEVGGQPYLRAIDGFVRRHVEDSG